MAQRKEKISVVLKGGYGTSYSLTRPVNPTMTRPITRPAIRPIKLTQPARPITPARISIKYNRRFYVQNTR